MVFELFLNEQRTRCRTDVVGMDISAERQRKMGNSKYQEPCSIFIELKLVQCGTFRRSDKMEIKKGLTFNSKNTELNFVSDGE